MILAACANLEAKKARINDLNVFPVPDGDTGTNMWLTMKAVADSLASSRRSSLGAVLSALSRQSLLGARGNSGVILAQFFDGFAGSLARKPSITADALAAAFSEGTRRAYRALKDPVEGTILTVMKAASETARKLKDHDDLNRVLRKVFKRAAEAQDRTPELLPVLKEAGVVDAGGEGFVTILEGFLASLEDRELNRRTARRIRSVDHKGEPWSMSTEDRYCLEFVLRGEAVPVGPLRRELGEFAESVIVARTGNLVKVHLHTQDPDRALALGEKHGEVCHVKLDDMKEMHTETLFPAKVGAVAVVRGEGFERIFRELGVSRAVPGGDSMNPSVEQILRAVQETPATKVIVLPNDPDVHMAAKEAAKLSPKRVHVLPTTSLPEGVAAMVSFDPEQGLAANRRAMREAIKRVTPGKVTRAVRDGSDHGIRFRKGEFIGLSGRSILAAAKSAEECTVELVRRLATQDTQVVAVYSGTEISKRRASGLVRRLREAFPGLEVQLYEGGQSHYAYIIGLLS